MFIDALPKNNYGKVLKTELRARDAAAGAAMTSLPPDRDYLNAMTSPPLAPGQALPDLRQAVAQDVPAVLLAPLRRHRPNRWMSGVYAVPVAGDDDEPDDAPRTADPDEP